MRPLVLLLCLLSSLPAAEFLPGVKRILFLGDSITYSGQYVDRFELFLFLQYPERPFEVINCGLPSETVSGLSEPGHAGGKFPRPDVHERLSRVLSKVKPDLVFACYGMNDGIYLPLDEARFARFQDGMQRLHDAVVKRGAKIIHLTPPVFDPGAGQDRATSYDAVLARYSEWLLAQRSAGWRVIDLHGPMGAALDARRKTNPGFTFARDKVHPDDAGHLVLGATLLAGLDSDRLPAFYKVFETEWASTTSFGSYLQHVRERGRLLADAWLTETGHQRPGMGKGLPLAEAQLRAAKLEKELREFTLEVLRE